MRRGQTRGGEAMSLLDQLRGLERDVQQRLRELRPLVVEYHDLEKLAKRLRIKRDETEPAQTRAAKPAPRAKSRAKPSRARAGKPSAAKRTAAKRAGTAHTPAAKQKPAAASGRTAKRRPTSRRTAAAPGQREQDVLRLVRQRPGLTVAELAAELSVDSTGLYPVVRRLQSRGQISKDGTRLQRGRDATPSADRSPTPPAQSSAVPPAPTASSPGSPGTPATDS